MYKFFSDVFGGEGSEILSGLSSLIFFTIFVVVLIRVYRLKKSEVEEYEKMPLDENDLKSTSNNE